MFHQRYINFVPTKETIAITHLEKLYATISMVAPLVFAFALRKAPKGGGYLT